MQSFPLLQPIKLGSQELRNRVVMAALTRMRADPVTGTPNELHAKYYSERAVNAGFNLTECTAISNQAQSFPGACNLFNEDHVAGWKQVTDAVHAVNGKLFLQIWHSGRTNRTNPVGPSPVPMRSVSETDQNTVIHGELPKELTEEELNQIVEDFRSSAKLALKAGLDGLELHGANGYLIDTFLRSGSNVRTDKFGGSVENRCRFPLMVMDALISVYGADRVGIKLTPCGRFQDMFEQNPKELMAYFLAELNNRNVAFIEVAQAPEFMPSLNLWGVEGEDQIKDMFKTIRPLFKGVLIANNGITFEVGNKLVEDGDCDMVSFGRSFISNPDLVERFVNGWPLTEVNYDTCYGGGAEGYTNYTKYGQN